MRPIFKHDPVRGVLLVWCEVERRGDHRLFAVNIAPHPDEIVQVAPGAEPPQYVPPIPDGTLFKILRNAAEA